MSEPFQASKLQRYPDNHQNWDIQHATPQKDPQQQTGNSLCLAPRFARRHHSFA
jgi:hypothetical protein